MINSLREMGYSIESGRSGYRFVSGPDKPLPWELELPPGTVKYFDSVDSTMRRASDLLEKGCPGGTTVIAGRQSGGIDRSGGKWKSPDGGLYLTRIRTEPFPAVSAALYCLSACAATAETLNRLYGGSGLEAQIEWPNALVSAGRRLGGVLTEFSGSLGMIRKISAGIGINVNTPLDSLPSAAVSIAGITGGQVSEKELTTELLRALEKNDEDFRPDTPPIENSEILRRRIVRMSQGGSSIILNRGSKSEKTRFAGITETGALIIETDGEKKIIYE